MNKDRTPVPSNHSLRPSFDTRKAMIMAMVVESPQNHQQAKANVSATDNLISAVYKYRPFSRPWFGMDFAALYQANTMLIPFEVTRNCNEKEDQGDLPL